MNNSLVRMRVIKDEVKMKREEIKEYETQSKTLVENLGRLIGKEATEAKFPVLVQSVSKYR